MSRPNKVTVTEEPLSIVKGCFIQWPSEEDVRARKVITRSSKRITGIYQSIKMGRGMHWESEIERDAIVLLDVDPAVLEFYEQPAKIIYQNTGSEREHFPDLFVRKIAGEKFVEVKTDEDAKDIDVVDRTEVLKPQLALIGYGYDLWVKSEIRKEPRLTNAKFLSRFARTKVELFEFEKVRVYCERNGGVMWDDVMNGCFGVYGVTIVCRLLYEGSLKININAEFAGQKLTFKAG